MILYAIYNILTRFLGLFSKIHLLYRLSKKKEDSDRMFEKIGAYKDIAQVWQSSTFADTTKMRPIWFHVASVGEMYSINHIVNQLSQNHIILISSVTLNSSIVFQKLKFNGNVVHVFAPFDIPKFINRFLMHFNPKIGIFIDSELWPNFIHYSSKIMPLLNINGRLSDNSAKRWMLGKSMITYMYDKFAKILPGSEDDYNKISCFARKEKMLMIGNTKFITNAIQANDIECKSESEMFKDRFVILLASTHDQEEGIILDAIKDLYQKHQEIAIIIAPRHPARSDAIQTMLQKKGLGFAIRSQKEVLIDKTVYIADTIGEMDIWYNIANLVIMGGSFVSIGGHNVIEPARFAKTVIIGYYYHNFRDIVELLRKNNAIFAAQDIKELSIHVANLYSKKDLLKKTGELALKTVTQTDILPKIISVIEESI